MLALAAAGCHSTPKPAAAPSQPGEITQVHIISMPVALNTDGAPGPDSISVKVFFNDTEHPKTIRMTRGILDIMMFDGALAAEKTNRVLLRDWTFDPAGLAAYEFTGGVGAGYEFTLPWGANRPSRRIVTVGARYTRPSGEMVFSSPASITVVDEPEKKRR
jgi:hypothetical protein